MDFLSEIIAVKRQRLAAAKARLPFEVIRNLARRIRRSSNSRWSVSSFLRGRVAQLQQTQPHCRV